MSVIILCLIKYLKSNYGSWYNIITLLVGLVDLVTYTELHYVNCMMNIHFIYTQAGLIQNLSIIVFLIFIMIV